MFVTDILRERDKLSSMYLMESDKDLLCIMALHLSPQVLYDCLTIVLYLLKHRFLTRDRSLIIVVLNPV